MGLALVYSSDQVKFTYDDYRQLPDDGKRYEIIDGELYMATSPTSNHQFIADNFLVVLAVYLKTNPVGKVVSAPLEVYFSKTNLAHPDVMFISKNRQDIIKLTQIKDAPDLIIEVLSRGTERRDRTIKRKMYAQFGVREYWLAKAETATVETLRLQDGKLVPIARLERAEALTSPLFPGLEIPLAEIFDFNFLSF